MAFFVLREIEKERERERERERESERGENKRHHFIVADPSFANTQAIRESEKEREKEGGRGRTTVCTPPYISSS